MRTACKAKVKLPHDKFKYMLLIPKLSHHKLKNFYWDHNPDHAAIKEACETFLPGRHKMGDRRNKDTFHIYFMEKSDFLAIKLSLKNPNVLDKATLYQFVVSHVY